MGDEPHVGLVDAHAERDRRDHDHAVLAQEPRLVARARRRRRARRGTAAPAMPLATRNSAVFSTDVARQAVDDARVARVLGAQQRRAAAGAARSSARCGTGCWAGRSWRRSAGRRSARAASAISRVGGARWRWRSARCAARRASARAASTAPGSRAGSRGPTATRSAPRRWRTARSCRGRAARRVDSHAAAARARGRAGRARRRGTRASTAPALVEVLRGVEEPGPHAERAQRVDLVLHERDQRRDRRRRCPARTSAGIW